MYCSVCGMVRIKDSLLLVWKEELMHDGRGFLSNCYLIGSTLNN